MYRLTMAVAITAQCGSSGWMGGGHSIELEHVQTDHGSSSHWPAGVGVGGIQ